MHYVGRPGISPALALLISEGRVTHRSRILDVGCGTGTDLLTLARWGFKDLLGVDPDAQAIRVARARATRMRLGRRVRFEVAGAESLSNLVEPRTFDLVLHTLVANNLAKDYEAHFSQVAQVLREDGVLLLHERTDRRHENSKPDRFPPLRALKRHFKLSQGVATHLAETPTGRRGPSYARVVVWLGTPKS